MLLCRTVYDGYKRTLVADDLFDLNRTEQSEDAVPKFFKLLDEQLQPRRSRYLVSGPPSSMMKVTFCAKSNFRDLAAGNDVQNKFEPNRQTLTLIKVIAKFIAVDLAWGAIIKFFQSLAGFAGPVVLQ